MDILIRMRLAFVLGTRPEIIKLFPLIKECELQKIEFDIIHTNQHYDPSMDQVFFENLELPQPAHNLAVGSGTQMTQIAKMLTRLEAVLGAEKYSAVIVQGDTNTVLAGALTASRLGQPVAHVEAGLRSFDRTMPEEVNRVVVDHISDFLFCPTDKQVGLSKKEGIEAGKIYRTGNTIVDAVCRAVELAKKKSDILRRLKLSPEGFLLLTCHRPANTDDEQTFNEILQGASQLGALSGKPVVFPIHPRLFAKREMVGNCSEIVPIEPVDYLDSLELQRHSAMILTDSGGIQEEACILEKKAIILRTNTERPETLEVGGAELLGQITADEIKKAFSCLNERKVKWRNPFGDGRSAGRILDILQNGLQ